METNNENNQNYDNDMYNNTYSDEDQLYSINRFNNRRNDRMDYRWDDRRDYRWDDRRDYRWDDNMYYNYPDCDRNGRCRNPIWWMFWPFFFF